MYYTMSETGKQFTSVPRMIPHGDLCRTRDDFVVVSACFNPRGFKRRYDLFRQFREYMAASRVTFIAVEVALGDRPWEVTQSSNPLDVQLRTRWELWHKEAALNVGFQHAVKLIPDCRYLAWLDGDVSFTRADWAAATCEALQHHAIVQMFGEVADLDPNEHVRWHHKYSMFRNYRELPYWYERGDKKALGHPGLAWAARRETLDKLGGLIDWAVSSSADTHMANALTGRPEAGDGISSLEGHSAGFIDAIKRWADLAEKVCKGNVGYVPGTIIHHWHGRGQQRGHARRWALVKWHQFDPQKDLIRECNGLYRLAPGREKLGDDIRRSLSERNEDGMDM